ncbi:MAG: membrane protein insertase YidC [Candidatus Cloacimonadaceae bacterium]|nr:membrane protein insertase YidC [Candidatus Cloacimonadota bacterium]MDX9949732.1 membrane protein insertase YidC [Candidatus Syntrophosphaera sp.]
MDKRTFFAMFIVVILFFVWSTYFAPKPKPVAQQDAPADTIVSTADSLQQPLVLQENLGDGSFSGTDSLQTSVLENKNFKVTLTNQGAAISSIELKKFKWADKTTPVDLVPKGEDIAGTLLLNHRATAPHDLRQLKWHVDQSDDRVVTFWLGDEGAPLVKKSYRLDEKYGILLDIEVDSPDPVYGIEHDFSAGIADSEKVRANVKNQDYKLILYTENAPQKIKLPDIKKKHSEGALNSFKWAALRTKYFTLAIMETGTPLLRNYSASLAKDTGNPAIVMDSRDGTASQKWKQSFTIYAGPADYELMHSYPNRLEQIPERGPGWLRWLANGIAWLLQTLHRFIPNYGVVIIIFAFLLKLITHPLTKKSMDANLKMQRIQPKVQEIQTKHKNDPKRMQEELSALYKEAGTSPMSGCLPLLLQMPIFIALYNVLRYTLDMRNAKFVFWLKDLSEPDSLMILPIIMAGFMILQSLMTRPSKEALEKMDEKQQAMQQSTRMMTWVMPIMLFFIFRGLPSGLVLYYTVFNMLSVAHQFYTQKRLKQKEQI